MRSAIFIILMTLAAPAFAQTKLPATGGDLSSICTGLLQQSAGGVSGDHTKLCACLAKETPSRLSMSEMMAYAQATMNSQPRPAPVMSKITEIATYCLQQAK